MLFTLFRADYTILYGTSAVGRSPANFALWGGAFTFLQSPISYTHAGNFNTLIPVLSLENPHIFTR